MFEALCHESSLARYHSYEDSVMHNYGPGSTDGIKDPSQLH